MRRIAVLDAPSNLGLRPPTVTSVPGCAKAPGALRDHGLITKLDARDAGCLSPPRYDAGDWRPGDGVAHAAQIATYSRKLADRIGAILDAGEFPVILGGDCSILLGSGLAMHRLGESVGGRIGLIFVDGHSDFRHPGNASYVGAAAGEDLALVTGRGQADLAAIEGRRPYFRDVDVVVMGIRAQDEYRLDLQAAGIVTRPVPALRAEGAARSAQWAREQLVDCAGYWVHMDVDVLDPAVMPAVDAPSPGGIAFPELEILLAGLVESPHCLGVEITVFDPDYDPDGSYASEIVNAITAGLANAHTVTPRPDLIAARADLSESVKPPAPDVAGPGRLGPTPPRFDRAESLSADRAESLIAGLNRADRDPTPSGLNRDGGAEKRESGGLNRDLGGLNRNIDLDGLNRGEAGSGGLNRGGSAAGLIRPRSPMPKVGRAESLIAGLNRGGAQPGGLRRPAGSASEPDDEQERQQRRAAAAADSVSLAAAGMSEGVPDEIAVPATTLLGVEEADEVTSGHEGTAEDTRQDEAATTVDPAGRHDAAPAGPDGTPAGEAVETESDRADDAPAGRYDAGPAGSDSTRVVGDADGEEIHAEPTNHRTDGAEPVEEPPADHWTDGEEPADDDGRGEDEAADGGVSEDDEQTPARPVQRPLGQAPLLDSEPLPATRPGMLRPRTGDEGPFSLPAQRPAFDLGSGTPADNIA